MSEAFHLPAELTIYGAAQVRGALLASIAAEQGAPTAPFVVDGAAVCEVDAAGIQLLVSLAQMLAKRGRKVQLLDPAAPLVRACRLLGVSQAFGVPA